MPRPFDVQTTSPASIAEIYAAFCAEEYWRDRIAEFGDGCMTLDSFSADIESTVSIATTQDLSHNLIPGGLARFLPGDLKIVREETWRPAGDRIDGEVSITASGVPGSGLGSAVLMPAAHGSTLRLAGNLVVRIPLVGGRIEQYIADVMAREIPAIQRFTTKWVANHG